MAEEIKNKEILELEEDSELEFVVAPAKTIPEGPHKAVISGIEIRNTPQGFKYVDFYFKVTDVEGEPEVKHGFPHNTSEKSSLVQFVSRLMPVKTGEKLNLNNLKGRKVKFVTYNQKTEKGEFARITPESIQPA